MAMPHECGFPNCAETFKGPRWTLRRVAHREEAHGIKPESELTPEPEKPSRASRFHERNAIVKVEKIEPFKFCPWCGHDLPQMLVGGTEVL